MATQLQFSRHTYEGHSDAPLDGSDVPSTAWEASHRHVAFAVHGAVPSPQLYLQRETMDRHPPSGKEENAYDTHRPSAWGELVYGPMAKKEPSHTVRTAPVRALREPLVGRPKAPVTKPHAKTTKPNASRAVPVKPVQKPGWDSEARATSNLFDTTLKKSVLFQPRPGNRLREVKQEEQLVRDVTSVKAPAAPVPVRRTTSNKWNARMAASLPMQQPKRRPKDYVKMNMEKITGQRYETLVRCSQAPTRPRGSVFERLSAPVVHKSLLRFRSPSPTRTPLHGTEQREERQPSPLSPALTISSPVLSTYMPQEAQSSSPRGRVFSNRHISLSRTSPTREGASTPPSTRRSTLSRTSSPGFRSDRGHEQISMTERVFQVLDRHGRGRIDVEQILDGLRLLQLPATHNQVADYVYLIHEGAINTVDYEEWAILVGTLDAASQSTGAAPSRASSLRSRSSPQALHDPSPSRSRSSMRTSPPRSLNQVQSPQKPGQYDLDRDSRDWARQGETVSLSVKMPQSNLARITKHSDDLADLILDDLLLDTVEELNKQERSQTIRKRQYLQAETLSSILQQIEHIETAEAELVDGGFAMGYNFDRGEAITAEMRDVRTPEKTAPNLRPSPQNSRTEDRLVLPLGIIMSVDVDGKSTYSQTADVLPELPVQHTRCEYVADKEVVDDRAPTEYRLDQMAASMSCLGGQMFQSVEKNRVRFLKHRQLVESSLESTGMDQASVIEMLADLLLDEIALECAVELENGVEALTDTLARTLL